MIRRAVLLATIPAPYRERVHELVHAQLLPECEYTVVYMAHTESNRQWDVEAGQYPSRFLDGRTFQFGGRYFHFNRGIKRMLDELDPDVVVTTSFQSTALAAFAWCAFHRRNHVAFSDGWALTERALSSAHKAVRRLVYSRTHAFIGGSRRTLDLYRSYGAPEQALFLSHLCVDNEAYAIARNSEKRFDVMLSGRIAPGKMPEFFREVTKAIHRRKNDLTVLIAGDGPNREALLRGLAEDGIATEYAGFVSQRELPNRYASARLLLFPTRGDAWGLVANEACAAGVPVITCRAAGAAGELVIDGVNGRVLPLESEAWADAAMELLTDPAKRERFARDATERVQEYNYENAARGIADAIRYCG